MEIELTKSGDIYAMPCHAPKAPKPARPHFDRAAIMKRAHAIKGERREAAAIKTFAAEAQTVAGRPHHPRTFTQVLKATPVDFSAAMKEAWAEAHRAAEAPAASSNAVAVINPGAGALAMIGEKIRRVDLVALIVSAGQFLDRHLIPEH